MIPLERIESFMRLLHKVQNVERIARIPDETERRNTAEHTFELTLLAWYIASVEKQGLDIDKVISYALAHDLIEAYAGDSYIYDKDAQASKKEREAAALARIESEFPEFEDLFATIHAYEAREDAESKFVYALDKLIDPLNISMETVSSFWKEYEVTLPQIHEYKDAKIATSKHVVPYWEVLLKKVEARKDFFFKE